MLLREVYEQGVREYGWTGDRLRPSSMTYGSRSGGGEQLDKRGGITIRPVRKASDEEVLRYILSHRSTSVADVVEDTAWDIGQVERLMRKRRRVIL